MAANKQFTRHVSFGKALNFKPSLRLDCFFQAFVTLSRHSFGFQNHRIFDFAAFISVLRRIKTTGPSSSCRQGRSAEEKAWRNRLAKLRVRASRKTERPDKDPYA